MAAFGLPNGHALADVKVVSAKLDVEASSAVELDDGDVSLLRLAIRPEARVRLGKNWTAESKVRIEFSDDDTGLGTIETYSDASRPIVLGTSGRIEVDEATLSWRKRSTRVTIGKQTVAWGVLDGLQVTDRFDAVRKRDAIFTDVRPERIGRWGGRLQLKASGTRIDAAVMVDGTVGQVATKGGAFFPTASRLRGGIRSDVVTPDIAVDRPGAATAGVRLSRSVGKSDVSVLMLKGPETEPVFVVSNSGVTAKYPTRSLYGVTWEKADGSKIWRIEAAHIPDQPINLIRERGMSTATEARWLAGAGMDWKTRSGAFVSAQLGVDHIGGGNDTLVRPSTDVITTIRVQKPLPNDSTQLSAELLTSLTDGDGTFRPQISWQANDNLRLVVGADVTFGDREGLFGQFTDKSRAWVKVRRSWG